MRRTSDNEEGSDSRDHEDENVMRTIEAPAAGSTERTVEILLFLDQSEGACCELHVCRTTPNCCNNRKDWRSC